MFEGGGIKGIAYVGALQVLAARGILGQVTAVAGTSAGAITACLVAAGYTPDELGTIMRALDLTAFEDGGFEGPIRVVEKYGWYRGDAFLSWLRTRISGKLGSPDAIACRSRSSLLPYSRRGSVFVDGGAVWNYPIEIFDDASPNPATLGLHLGLLGKKPPPPRPIHELIEYVKRLYDAITRVQSDYFERSPADVARSVFIDDLGLSATDFAITEAQKDALIANGVAATTAYLDSSAGPKPG